MRIFHNLKPTSRREKMKSYSTSRRPQSANPVKAKPNLERAESYSFQKYNHFKFNYLCFVKKELLECYERRSN